MLGNQEADLGLQHTQAAQLEVMEEALAREEVARQLLAVLQQPLTPLVQLRRKCKTRLHICTTSAHDPYPNPTPNNKWCSTMS